MTNGLLAAWYMCVCRRCWPRGASTPPRKSGRCLTTVTCSSTAITSRRANYEHDGVGGAVAAGGLVTALDAGGGLPLTPRCNELPEIDCRKTSGGSLPVVEPFNNMPLNGGNEGLGGIGTSDDGGWAGAGRETGVGDIMHWRHWKPPNSVSVSHCLRPLQPAKYLRGKPGALSEARTTT